MRGDAVVGVESTFQRLSALFLAEEFIFNGSNQIYDIIIVHFTGELSSARAGERSTDTVAAWDGSGGVLEQHAHIV